MSKRTQPYDVQIPNVDLCGPFNPPLFTRRHFGYGAFYGLVTHGSKHTMVPIQHPYPGQGASFPAFPHFTGSSVAPDIVATAILIARNLFSPSGHSNPLSNVVPPMAIPPEVYRRPPQTQSGRPSGVFTIPDPVTTTWWPDQLQWLQSRLPANYKNQPPSGWVSQRTPPR